MKIETLRIEIQNEYGAAVLFPSLVCTGKKTYLVDCGYGETFEQFVSALQSFSLSVKDLEGVIISHDDIDHIGGLAKFKEHHPALKIICGSIEAPAITGKVKSERLSQAEKTLPDLEGEAKTNAMGFIQSLQNIQRFEADRVLDDGERLDERLMVVHTPGHTKEHISLYDPEQKTLIANDALVIEDGIFNIANPSFTLDIDSAVLSIEKIKKLRPEKAICYHGGTMDAGVMQKLEDVISRYKNMEGVNRDN